MSPRSFFRSPIFGYCVAVAGLVLSAACSSAPMPFLLHPEASVNVAAINPKWPKHFEDLTPAQQDIWNRRGRPQMAHLQWSTTQDIVDRSRILRTMQNTGQKVEETPFAWIYLNDKTEVLFPDETRAETRPLSDALLAILEFGDPEQVRMLASETGKRTEVWMYVSRGVKITFENGKRIATDDSSIPAMPAYLAP